MYVLVDCVKKLILFLEDSTVRHRPSRHRTTVYFSALFSWSRQTPSFSECRAEKQRANRQIDRNVWILQRAKTKEEEEEEEEGY